MSMKADLAAFIRRHTLEPFVNKPGMNLPKNTLQRLMTVEEKVGGKTVVDHFVHTAGKEAVSTTSSKVLDMVPMVKGGFREGDIVLRGNSWQTTAQSGLVTTLSEGLRTGDWKVHQSAVSHAGIVARNTKGELRVIQMVSGETPEHLVSKLTPMQKRLKATFLREDSIHDFFNVKGVPITRSTVMRPKDPKAAYQAARRAEEYLSTQVTEQGAKPWFSKLPHSLSPDKRGGVCSTFVDLAFGEAFKPGYMLPTTPHHFVISPLAEKVGERAVTKVQALGQALGEGVKVLTRR